MQIIDIDEDDKYIISKSTKQKKFTKEEQREKHRKYVSAWRKKTSGASVYGSHKQKEST